MDANSNSKINSDALPTPAKRTHRLVRIAEGIYRDRGRLAAVVKVGRHQREKRFPRTTALKKITKWRRDKAESLRKLHPRATRGTLAADVLMYLRTLANKPRLQALRRVHLAWWVERFGHRDRQTLEASELKAALAEFAITPLKRWPTRAARLPSASTVRHYRTALYSLFSELDGKNAPNPLRDVAPVPSDEPQPRSLPYEVIDAIFDVMPERGQGVRHRKRATHSKTKWRLRLMADTSLPPAQIMLLLPEHANWDEPSVLVQGRKKGRGTRMVRYPLTEQGAATLKMFFTIGAQGRFSTSSARASWWRAIHAMIDTLAATDFRTAKTLRATLLTFKPRPYDLRHSFLTEAWKASKDRAGVSLMAMHSDTRMTRRYTLAAEDGHMREIADKISAWFRRPVSLAVEAGTNAK